MLYDYKVYRLVSVERDGMVVKWSEVEKFTKEIESKANYLVREQLSKEHGVSFFDIEIIRVRE